MDSSFHLYKDLYQLTAPTGVEDKTRSAFYKNLSENLNDTIIKKTGQSEIAESKLKIIEELATYSLIGESNYKKNNNNSKRKFTGSGNLFLYPANDLTPFTRNNNNSSLRTPSEFSTVDNGEGGCIRSELCSKTSDNIKQKHIFGRNIKSKTKQQMKTIRI